MSKSDPADLSRINMTDDADTIARKIQKAKTDPAPLPAEPTGLAGRPEAENLVGIHAALSGTTAEAVLRIFGGQQFSAFKKALTELTVERIAPISAEMKRLMADPAEIDRVLADGSVRARAVARPVMDKVREIVGFVGSSRG
jgi:tryptophanyl-tRNA synthetase